MAFQFIWQPLSPPPIVRNKWPRTRRVDYQHSEGEGFKEQERRPNHVEGQGMGLAAWLSTFSSRLVCCGEEPRGSLLFWWRRAISLWSSSKSSFSSLPRKIPNSEDWCVLVKRLSFGGSGKNLKTYRKGLIVEGKKRQRGANVETL